MPAPGTTGLFVGLEQLRTEVMVGFDAVELTTPFLDPAHLATVDLGDKAGNTVRVPYLGGSGDYEEEFGDGQNMDDVGAYYLDLLPVAFRRQWGIFNDDHDDQKLDTYNARLQGDGAAAKRHRARRMIAEVVEGSKVGFDGLPLFSASHTWVPSGQDDHKATYTSVQGNIVSGFGVATRDDLWEAASDVEAKYAALLNDRGNEFNPEEASWTVVASAKNSAMRRLILEAFGRLGTEVMPGDDTSRTSNLRGYSIMFDPYLTNNTTWYMLANAPGRPKAMGMLSRKEPEVTTWRDENKPKGGAQIVRSRMRYEVFANDWTQAFQIQP